MVAALTEDPIRTVAGVAALAALAVLIIANVAQSVFAWRMSAELRALRALGVNSDDNRFAPARWTAAEYRRVNPDGRYWKLWQLWRTVSRTAFVAAVVLFVLYRLWD